MSLKFMGVGGCLRNSLETILLHNIYLFSWIYIYTGENWTAERYTYHCINIQFYNFRMAPEVIMCETLKDSPYNFKADIWSLGKS